MTVRVRFAPSPTGALHVGSARTALFNWLYARHHHGTLILRIEDTDQKRSSPAFLQDILESLKFLGLSADEGPIFQSQRLPLHQRAAEQLLSSGQAVREEGAIVFPVPPGRIEFQDLIHGPISVDTTLFEKLVLMKSDGSPAYNFACVVDDADMRITHVIRGDDHIANTPKQVVLYRALGMQPPQYAHIPLILGQDREKLSKRHGATNVAEYRAFGYLPEAFVNYLALLGWSPGDNREVLSIQELIDLFDLDRVRKSAAQFDQRKLDWLNGQHIKQISPERLAELFADRLHAAGAEGAPNGWSQERLARLAALLKERLKTLKDLEDEHWFFFLEEPAYQPEAVEKFLKPEGTAARLRELKARLEALSDFEAPRIEEATRGLITERQLQTKELIHPARVAITGRAVSPPLFETMALLGRATVLKRLDYAATNLAR